VGKKSRERPSCEELPGNTIICCEMDLFELYICLVIRGLRRGRNISNVSWKRAEISGRTVIYPYIEEIWDFVVKEYRSKTCTFKESEIDSDFSRKIKGCGIGPQENRIESTSAVADLIFYINKEQVRAERYDDLIAFLCLCSKKIYDRIDCEMKSNGLLEGVQKSLDNMLDDYHNSEIRSNAMVDMDDVAERKRKKLLEDHLNRGEQDRG